MAGPLRYWEDVEVGQAFELGSRTLSRHDIIGFAVDYDPQLFHLDPEMAKGTSFGGLIASGLQTLSVGMRLLADGFLNPDSSMGSPGLDELRWLKPVWPEDTLTLRIEITDKRASRSRPEMGSVMLNWTLSNQRGEPVLAVKGVNLMRRRPSTTTVKRAVKGIDHAVVVVRDLDDAQRRYTRLGFTVQPRGRHVKLGTANHLMIFERNYFELIAVVEPNGFNESRRQWLQRTGGGLANIALATDDADLAHGVFARAGLEPEPVLDFGRAVEIGGQQEEAKFRTVRIPKQFSPVLGFFVCDHLTPQFVYRSEWAHHPNGARGLAGATVVAREPAAFIDLCGRHFGKSAVHRWGANLRVETGTQPILYLTPEVFADHYPGLVVARDEDHAALLSFHTTATDKVAELLQANGVPHIRVPDGRVLVSAGEASGTAIEFVGM